VGEIESFRALEIGEAKWFKEHIPRKGNNLNDITDEGPLMGMSCFKIEGQNEQ
jgi:hypothetical protein